MKPIKLTANHYINPAAVVRVVFDPNGESGDRAYFGMAFTSDDLSPLYLHGTDAEEAFNNWTRLHDQNPTNTTPVSTL
jgi:hypothetical protein